MTADPIDPARVREAVERVRDTREVNADVTIRSEDAELLCTAAFNSLTQRDCGCVPYERQCHFHAGTPQAEMSREIDRLNDLVREQSEAMAILDQDRDRWRRQWHEAVAARDQLRSELEAARAERDRLNRCLEAEQQEIDAATRDRIERLLREIAQLRTQLSTAQADAQGLREALRPFARVADERPDYEKSARLVTHGMTLGHCRAARAALEGRGEKS